MPQLRAQLTQFFASQALPEVAADLNSRLVDLTHQNRIDIVVLNDAPPELAVTSLDAAPPLFVADPEAAHAFVRNARLRLADIQPFLDRVRRLKLEALVR